MDQPMKKLALGLLLSFGGLSAALAQGSNRIDAYGNFIPNMGGTQTIAATTTSASVTLTATDLQNTDLNLFNLGNGLGVLPLGQWRPDGGSDRHAGPGRGIEDVLQVPGDSILGRASLRLSPALPAAARRRSTSPTGVGR
jgi:hypothetical protein